MGRHCRCHVVIGMLLALLFVSGCATTTLVRPQPTPLPTATAQPPNPFPLTAPLDPPPTTCRAARPTTHHLPHRAATADARSGTVR
jgi:hypothetical protein